MRTTFLAVLPVLAGAAAPALASEAALVALNEAHAASLSFALDKQPALKISVQTQFQYNLNLRDDDSAALAGDNDDVTASFTMRRTRLNLGGPVTDSIDGKMQIDFNAGDGSARILEAYADWKVDDGLTLRIGQQKVHFLREDTVGTVRMLTSDFSVQNRVFGQGYAQFVEAAYTADGWRGWVSVSDGFGTENTAFNDAGEADFALTARAELRFGDADWKAHNQFTSWRGSASGGVAGLAAHYQTAGSTNPALPEDETLLTTAADFKWVGDGWNAFVSGVWARSDDGTAEFDDFGLMAQAGVFITDQIELFGRWDGVFADDDRAADVSDFHTLTAGFNYYLVPESHAAKFTFNVMYYFDAVGETGGLVSPSTAYNLLADSEDGQVALTAQLQLLF